MKPKDLEEIENRRSHYYELVKDMPYREKVNWAKTRIKEFFVECENRKLDEVTISFSGGKDSTVLLDLVNQVHTKMKSNIKITLIYATEITFPSTLKFIKETNKRYQKLNPYINDVQIAYPKKSWVEILSQDGYPIYSKQISMMLNRIKHCKTKNCISKWFFGVEPEISSTARYKLSKKRMFLIDDNMIKKWPDISKDKEMSSYFAKYNDFYFFSEKCCDFIKGNIKHDERPSFIGTMAEESELRKKSWIIKGCNIFSKTAMKSRPLSLWTADNIWQYIKENDLLINEAYGYDPKKSLEDQNLRFTRLGCTSCPYGARMEDKIFQVYNKKIEGTEKPKKLNRFEVLYKDYPNLYKSQVITNGMYKILIDMDIQIRNDELYMKLYELRHRDIDNWYDDNNFKKNIISVMCQVENYKDYKEKGKDYTWEYSLSDFQDAMNYFGLTKTSSKEIQEIRKQVKLDYFILKDKL